MTKRLFSLVDGDGVTLNQYMDDFTIRRRGEVHEGPDQLLWRVTCGVVMWTRQKWLDEGEAKPWMVDGPDVQTVYTEWLVNKTMLEP